MLGRCPWARRTQKNSGKHGAVLTPTNDSGWLELEVFWRAPRTLGPAGAPHENCSFRRTRRALGWAPGRAASKKSPIDGRTGGPGGNLLTIPLLRRQRPLGEIGLQSAFLPRSPAFEARGKKKRKEGATSGKSKSPRPHRRKRPFDVFPAAQPFSNAHIRRCQPVLGKAQGANPKKTAPFRARTATGPWARA